MWDCTEDQQQDQDAHGTTASIDAAESMLDLTAQKQRMSTICTAHAELLSLMATMGDLQHSTAEQDLAFKQEGGFGSAMSLLCS